jgi:hypothetical protein
MEEGQWMHIEEWRLGIGRVSDVNKPIHTHTYIHTYTHTHMRTRARARTHTYVRTYIIIIINGATAQVEPWLGFRDG